MTQETLNFDSDRESQCKQILAYLKSGNRVTSLDSLRLFGCLRLSGRIYDLREAGEPIVSEIVKLPNKKRVAEYPYDPSVKTEGS